MHGGAPGGRLRSDGAEAAGLQPAALSEPETVPAQEHHATGGAPDGDAAPRGRLGGAEENGGAQWHGGCGGFGGKHAARPRVAAGHRTVARAAPGAAPEPERGRPRHPVDVVGLGPREPREAAARVPGRFVHGLWRQRRGRDIQCLRAGQRRHRAGDRGLEPRGEAPVPRRGPRPHRGRLEPWRKDAGADGAEARRRAARGRGPLRRNCNFVHRRHVLSEDGVVRAAPAAGRAPAPRRTNRDGLERHRRGAPGQSEGVRERTVDAAATRVECECRTRQLFGDDGARERREGRKVVPARRRRLQVAVAVRRRC
mmetsp:Transcript_21204/g.65293  ORF Transcript_21204/g.65293 Transcript_21204/m.65293 type:complete len:312 (-) Transcript_21204:589-1524(-)